MGSRVALMTWVPEACTLPTAEHPVRVAEFDDLLAMAIQPTERVGPTELRIRLPAGDEPRSRQQRPRPPHAPGELQEQAVGLPRSHSQRPRVRDGLRR